MLWLTIFMPLVGISWARPQFFDSEERHLHRHHHRRPSFGGGLHNDFNQQGQPFGPQNGFSGGNFGSRKCHLNIPLKKLLNNIS